MKEIHANASYKVLNVILDKGDGMPLHYATSDAFLVIREGKGILKISEREIELEPGTALSIPANEPHSLHILADFAATVVLAADARIDFINNTILETEKV